MAVYTNTKAKKTKINKKDNTKTNKKNNKKPNKTKTKTKTKKINPTKMDIVEELENIHTQSPMDEVQRPVYTTVQQPLITNAYHFMNPNIATQVPTQPNLIPNMSLSPGHMNFSLNVDCMSLNPNSTSYKGMSVPLVSVYQPDTTQSINGAEHAFTQQDLTNMFQLFQGELVSQGIVLNGSNVYRMLNVIFFKTAQGQIAVNFYNPTQDEIYKINKIGGVHFLKKPIRMNTFNDSVRGQSSAMLILKYIKYILVHSNLLSKLEDVLKDSKKVVKVSMDLYYNRVTPGAGFAFHRDTVDESTWYVNLTYHSNTEVTGPELVALKPNETDVKDGRLIFRPAIPPYGTVGFADNYFVHSSPSQFQKIK